MTEGTRPTPHEEPVGRPVGDEIGPRHGGPQEVRAVVAAQHRHLRDLVEAVRDAHPARGEALSALLRYVAAHEVVEQNSLHPVLGRGSTEDGEVGARVSEEREATDAMERLERLDPGGTAFERGFDAWAEALLAHAEAEERDELGTRLEELDEAETSMVLRLLDQVDSIAASDAMTERAAGDGGFAALVDAARLEVSRRLD
ncbi:hemerythrin domain-containing protein [Phycicoccus sp. M110.8]|uniref:hemerythrin domain-containing protein n=1 Tax=Phycicoccus sp. M110.8 TaxID=3075433 RepID=UPI0028FD6B70|nr:hemerythrin domain-containing protein [Phycicoccus sp. M110.8]MDU0315369.1 hemerythrin domain-containing protein [Phycicoccus sp. M110.8]